MNAGWACPAKTSERAQGRDVNAGLTARPQSESVDDKLPTGNFRTQNIKQRRTVRVSPGCRQALAARRCRDGSCPGSGPGSAVTVTVTVTVTRRDGRCQV